MYVRGPGTAGKAGFKKRGGLQHDDWISRRIKTGRSA
jgi:hypothetical protein